MRIIAIANQKGGVGKTPTTVNIAFALARAGHTILLVDLDPQGSLSEYFLADQADIQEVTVYNALSDLQRIEPLSLTKQIALLPAHDELAGAELELPSKVNGQKRLAKVLSFYQAEYEFCLLDCPPSLGILTINALASAHQVVIPVKTEISAEDCADAPYRSEVIASGNVAVPFLRLKSRIKEKSGSRSNKKMHWQFGRSVHGSRF
jgi:chromosome partitioning protein